MIVEKKGNNYFSISLKPYKVKSSAKTGYRTNFFQRSRIGSLLTFHGIRLNHVMDWKSGISESKCIE